MLESTSMKSMFTSSPSSFNSFDYPKMNTQDIPNLDMNQGYWNQNNKKFEGPYKSGLEKGCFPKVNSIQNNLPKNKTNQQFKINLQPIQTLSSTDSLRNESKSTEYTVRNIININEPERRSNKKEYSLLVSQFERRCSRPHILEKIVQIVKKDYSISIIPEVRDQLDKLLIDLVPNINYIRYMVDDNILVPSSKSVIFALIFGNEELYNIIYNKFKGNLYKYIDESDNNLLHLKLVPKFIHHCGDIINIAIYMSLYGKADKLERLLNDFREYLDGEHFMDTIYYNCICYGAYVGNLDIIITILYGKYRKSHNLSNYLNEAASVAYYNNKKNIYEYLCNYDRKLKLHLVDLCVYTGNLDLLKEIYNKYDTIVSYWAIIYCIEKNMIDFISFFIFDMKIECCKEILEYYPRLNQLVNSQNNDNNRDTLHKRRIQHEDNNIIQKRKISPKNNL